MVFDELQPQSGQRDGRRTKVLGWVTFGRVSTFVDTVRSGTISSKTINRAYEEHGVCLRRLIQEQ